MLYWIINYKDKFTSQEDILMKTYNQLLQKRFINTEIEADGSSLYNAFIYFKRVYK